jgi:hypothetical protein
VHKLDSGRELIHSLALQGLAGTGRRSLFPLTVTTWRGQQGALARYLTSEQWDKLGNFYFLVQQVEGQLQGRQCVPLRERGLPAAAMDEGVRVLRMFEIHIQLAVALRNARPCLFPAGLGAYAGWSGRDPLFGLEELGS